MCGIYFCRKYKKRIPAQKHSCLTNRGPDSRQIVETDDYLAAFYRLAIVGVESGMQPFILGDCILLCNGEIYNHLELEQRYGLSCVTKSDCECILHLYKKVGIDQVLQDLNGEFAFVLYDAGESQMYFARDRLGRKPLFWAHSDEYTEVCSLYAGLGSSYKSQVTPGLLYHVETDTGTLHITRYHKFACRPSKVDRTQIMQAFIKEVQMRVCQSERPVGFLLSGGFDSSLVLSVALKYVSFATPPHVFTIGFDENAPDVKSAEIMVRWLRKTYGDDCIVWHRVIMPLSDGLSAIPHVVGVLETYDTTTIRASTPMYLISKYIQEKTDVRVVLSGEGSDELFGGYMYFKYAPSDEAFRREIIDRLHELYLYDVLRADRTTADCGLEVRTPFLGDEFVRLVLSSDELVRCKSNTKELIRATVEGTGLLPEEILHGKKEAFSDAVGMSWKDAIQLYCEKVVLPDFEHSKYIAPQTKEMYYFQFLFESKFPKSWHLLKKLWLPPQDWVKTGVEPSARVLAAYVEHKG